MAEEEKAMRRWRHREANAEVSAEWDDFRDAVSVSRPAAETFTPAALMLLFITMGRGCLLPPEKI